MLLTDYLTENQIKPSAFAEELGVPPSTVSRWLRRERTPRIEHIAAITKATKGAVTPSDFLPAERNDDKPEAA